MYVCVCVCVCVCARGLRGSGICIRRLRTHFTVAREVTPRHGT